MTVFYLLKEKRNNRKKTFNVSIAVPLNWPAGGRPAGWAGWTV